MKESAMPVRNLIRESEVDGAMRGTYERLRVNRCQRHDLRDIPFSGTDFSKLESLFWG